MPFGIYFEGTAEKLDAGDEQTTAYQCLSTRFSRGKEILEEAKDPNGHQFYKITVKNWYAFGKLDDQGVTKHQLTWNGGKK